MSKTREPDSSIIDFFSHPGPPAHKQYEALRMFFLEGASAKIVAEKYGYTEAALYTIARDFKKKLSECLPGESPFFKTNKVGRKAVDRDGDDAQLIIRYRKMMLSIPEIAILLAGLGKPMSAALIWNILKDNGFARLPKRDAESKQVILETSGYTQLSQAAASTAILFDKKEGFQTSGAGILCFLPIIQRYGIDQAILNSDYPGTAQIPTISAILSFIALKVSSVERFGHDDGWCMDRGLGLFAGLNVLPKTTWFSLYSSKVTREMNISFLKSLNQIWDQAGLLGDTVNMDFTTIPYWGDSDTFENNWTGRRHKALASIEAALAHDPDSGIICYGDTTIEHDTQNDTVLRFLDFYSPDDKKNINLKYLVFDSKFTVYRNLGKLDDKGIRFITIQRKSATLRKKISEIPKADWKNERIELENHKSRIVNYAEGETSNREYGPKKTLRQIYIDGNHEEISTIITNETALSAKEIIRKYARRWLVENEIQEHIDFFHLNRNSSGIVVKVDFDLTMTILAHNLYRLLALEIPRYHHALAKTIFTKITSAHGEVLIHKDIEVKLDLRRTTPLLNEAIPKGDSFSWLGGKKIIFTPNNHN